MKTISGTYFDGQHPIALPAALEIYDQQAILISGTLKETFEIRQLKVSPRVGNATRFINFPNCGQFCCSHKALLNTFPQESVTERPVAWLESRWKAALSCVVFVVGILCAAYIWGLPKLSEIIVAHVPIETEKSLGQKTLSWLDQNWFDLNYPLYIKNKEQIVSGFEKLCSNLPSKNVYNLEFRVFRNHVRPPNAFALPGGTILVTDDMSTLAEASEEMIAVLAHEIGHLELRHILRQMLQSSGTALIAATLTPDANSFANAVTSYPLLFATTKYSREFEAAADEFAFEILKKNGYSPLAFATMMERLDSKYEIDKYNLSFVSTHPITKERIARARKAAGK